MTDSERTAALTAFEHALTTYTIWWRDGGGREESLTYAEMVEAADRFGFAALPRSKRSEETYILEGDAEVTDQALLTERSDGVVGGCFSTTSGSCADLRREAPRPQ